MIGDQPLSCIFVIFGGTGNLAHKKLVPAIYNLMNEDIPLKNFAVVSVGRRIKTNEEYRDELLDSIKRYARFEVNPSWQDLMERIYYESFEFHDEDGYRKLKGVLDDLDKKHNTNGNRIYYLATAPEYFDGITSHLYINDGVDPLQSWQRLVIEKPFGRDLGSAEMLNKNISKVFAEENIYRIDHYLGKEMIQNIMFIRFSNIMFESIWNNRCIDNIQITASEDIGIENRGEYYEKSGALKDMVQNHLLQILALTAMDMPKSFSTKDIRDEKLKVIRALKEFSVEDIHNSLVVGQYISKNKENKEGLSYRDEKNVSKKSNTETFAALKIFIDNDRWQGVPFYIRTGKRLYKREAYISIQFKDNPEINRLYGEKLDPNLLMIKIQPQEGVSFKFNMKEPRTTDRIVPAKMDFCQNCQVDYQSPEAYERLILDVMKGDSTLFTRWDVVEHSWRFMDKITKVCRKESDKMLKEYVIGSDGPLEADTLLTKDGRKWWRP